MKRSIMKKVVSSVLVLSLMFAVVSPVCAVEDSSENLTTIHERITSGNITMDQTFVYDVSGNVHTTITESENYYIISERQNNNISTEIFEKKDNNELEPIKSFAWSVNDDSSVAVPYARRSYTSEWCPDDSYSYYTDLDVWHLYYGGEHVYSGDTPSNTILGHCENFKTYIHEMDDEGDEIVQSLVGIIPGVGVLQDASDVVVAFAEGGMGDGIRELTEALLMNLVSETFGVVVDVGEAAAHGLLMYDAHESYEYAYNQVVRLTA